MRRRFVKENRKENIKTNDKPIEKPVAKIVAKPIEEKEEKKEEVKSIPRKDFATSENVCTNLLPNYNIIGEKSTTMGTLEPETFFRFLFENVLEYEDIKEGDETKVQFIPAEGNIFNQVNGMKLNGNLIASSALYYSTDHYAVGMVIDGIRDAENNLISQINIKFKGDTEPGSDITEKEIAWIVATDCCIYPAIEGSKLSDVMNVLDQTQTNYGEHQPINKPAIVKSFALKSYYPNRKLDVRIPGKDYIPTEEAETKENICGYATGYFFLYNIAKDKVSAINGNIQLVLSYVSVPLSYNGTNKIISLGDVVSAVLNSQEGATNPHLISVKGNSANDCGFPRNSSFYQNNFGDAKGSRSVAGDFEILYPAAWWTCYGKVYPTP